MYLLILCKRQETRNLYLNKCHDTSEYREIQISQIEGIIGSKRTPLMNGNSDFIFVMFGSQS